MSEEKSSPVNLYVLSSDADVAAALIEDICSEEAIDRQMTRIQGTIVCVEQLVGAPEDTSDWHDRLEEAGAVLLGVRHVDMMSLEALSRIMVEVGKLDTPFGIVILRGEDETDFKMSCVYCGQKLWVVDEDVDKRGRCPNCQKAFTLPAQHRLLRMQLKLPDSVSVQVVNKSNPYGVRGAVANIVDSAHGDIFGLESEMDPETLKNSTVRVQIQDLNDD